MGKLLNKIICGNSVSILKKIPSGFVDCVITSPPYWALRDYGLEPQSWDGDENCEHEWETKTYQIGNRAGNKDRNQPFFTQRHNVNEQYKASMPTADFCLRCRAWQGSLGLEPSFDLYIKHLCDIFDEIKRVLREDGTCWVNLGDTYSGGGNTNDRFQKQGRSKSVGEYKFNYRLNRIQEKCLCLIPFRFAIEMVNRGWILRNTIIWHKRNCMPSSIKDRFTVDFEYVFFFVKNRKYWFETQYENSLYKTEIPTEKSDRQQYLINKLYQIKKDIRDEKIAYSGKSKDFSQYNNALANAKAYRTGLKILQEQEHLTKEDLSFLKDYTQNHFSRPQGRNKRCVWDITTKPFKEAHFAVFPETLVEPMIKAGCPEFVCKKCRKAREKIWHKELIIERYTHDKGKVKDVLESNDKRMVLPRARTGIDGHNEFTLKGYTNCNCNAGFDGGIVLDPFCGSGTTLLMAKRLGRNYIGIDMNPEYVKMSKRRIEGCLADYKVKKREKP